MTDIFMTKHRHPPGPSRTADAVLAAATRVFRRDGALTARIESVCAEAGLPLEEIETLYPSTEDMLSAILARDFTGFREQLGLLLSSEGLAWLSHLDDKEGGMWLADNPDASFDRFLMQVEFDIGTANLITLFKHPDWRHDLLAAETGLIRQVGEQLSQGQREGWIAHDVDCAGTAFMLYTLFVGLLTTRDMDIPTDHQALARAIARLCRTLIPA